LWISSLCAGWLENWSAYRRLPEAIAEHWLGRFVGRRTMAWMGRAFSRNIAGFGGNTSLGVLLAATPIAGKFFGLPLDVRHVTLSTGALTLATSSLGVHPFGPEALPAAIGIAAIGTLNFGVSFVLSLRVALRARQVERKDRWRLLAALFLTFLKSPFQFFFPPRNADKARVHGPVSVAPPPPA
jgi:site-specific recombinase